MGDHGSWEQPSCLPPNGLLPEETAKVTQVLDADIWFKAEEQTAELIGRIQPNQSSEERRNAVAIYVQRLIINCLSCRVFTFGSVPLKTYLPDGDIDLTAFSDNENLKDTWATAVCGVLENEEKSENAEFRVKEVKYIQAEMDKVINQNHLFKRSIILIKAWCYYESRILGAHHGLISTYALETLVLYIFHVFNNSFAGPLEVLYRFLEFFSNFDWDNYCISLWGPVPISSLPDMTAEPPRKDNGKLLFSKGFLDNRTALYSVTPGGQENHNQPFVSKHFNVVDPLRTNNNLGRSVSKGNFFRIRSAFAFGAKRLARLIECPKDDIIAEVNQFFMNTWKRHGSGDRPDVLSLDLRNLPPLKTVPVEESNNSKCTTSVEKKFENGVLQVIKEHLADTGHGFHNSTSEMVGNDQNVYRSNKVSVLSHVENQINNEKQTNLRFTDQLERSHSSGGSDRSNKNQKMFKPNCSAYDRKEQGRFQFARTRSSPELTETSFDLSQGSHGRAIETAKFQNPAKFDSGIRRWNLGSEVMGSHSSKSSLDDYKSTRQTSSQKNVDVASDANSVSNSHQGDFGFTNLGEELASASETLEMQQEEQDLVNMMGSSNIHGLDGLVQFPMHLAPLHLPLTFPTPMGYFKRNLAGAIPSNISFIGPPWGPNMPFAQSLVSFPLSHSNFKDVNESFNDGFSVMQLNTEDNDHGNLHEDDVVSSRGLNPGDSGTQILHLDDKQQKLEGGLTSSHGARSTRSGSLPRGQNKLGRESRNLTREDYNGSFLAKTSRGGDIHSNFRSSNSRFSLSQASSSRNKPASENSRDRSAANISKPARDKWGRKPASPSVSASYHGKENSGLQFEGSSDNVSLKLDENTSGWISLSAMGNDTSEKTVESKSLASSHARSEHLPGYESAQFQSDPFIPFSPVLVGTSQQRGVDYSKILPMAFVATGPPVPYLVFPFGNFTSNTGNPDGYARQFDKEEESDQFPSSSSCENIDSVESLSQSEALMSPTVSRDSGPESSAETSSDILNSDLNGHWQNLVYGRFCQNHYQEPFVYSSPVVGPPIYPISHFPWDGSGRPLSSNLNYAQIMGHGPRLVPVIPLQPGHDQASGVFQHHADEAPRYRGGTGTYLPNPKVPFRDRQSSSRIQRGNRNYDRNDLVDREANWVTSKPRDFDRSHGRNQAERPSMRPDRLAALKNQEVKKWESNMHEPLASYHGHGDSFPSANSSHNLGMYPQTAFSSVAVSPSDPTVPPVVLMCPYDQGAGYGLPAEALEFGSLRPVHLSSGNGAPRAGDRITEGGPYDRSYSSFHRGGSRSSPDQPSSP
ncbi:Nucleotidyltransferase domain [Musa troglodytarum]|uniref:Nucleotidyltransferase domain n=1 Tax=Musa troglodytarum TaxID=320322 RepID=A0A9E7L743_9LILI|nr:Nucleotidyltransferase domain [Musa troglodytarum]